MLYIGHFEFDYEGKEGETHKKLGPGEFTAVVEANSAEEAVAKLTKLMRKVRKTEDTFEDVLSIYLAALVEVKRMPAGGFISYVSYRTPLGEDGDILMCTSARGADKRLFNVYAEVGDPSEVEGDEETIEPFLVFKKW
jgi:hypothetical protein